LRAWLGRIGAGTGASRRTLAALAAMTVLRSVSRIRCIGERAAGTALERLYLGAFTQFVEAVDDDGFAWLDPAIDGCLFTVYRTGGDLTNRNGFVGLDYIHKIATVAALDG